MAVQLDSAWLILREFEYLNTAHTCLLYIVSQAFLLITGTRIFQGFLSTYEIFISNMSQCFFIFILRGGEVKMLDISPTRIRTGAEAFSLSSLGSFPPRSLASEVEWAQPFISDSLGGNVGREDWGAWVSLMGHSCSGPCPLATLKGE
jgi:hypothetical protein